MFTQRQIILLFAAMASLLAVPELVYAQRRGGGRPGGGGMARPGGGAGMARPGGGMARPGGGGMARPGG